MKISISQARKEQTESGIRPWSIFHSPCKNREVLEVRIFPGYGWKDGDETGSDRFEYYTWMEGNKTRWMKQEWSQMIEDCALNEDMLPEDAEKMLLDMGYMPFGQCDWKRTFADMIKQWEALKIIMAPSVC